MEKVLHRAHTRGAFENEWLSTRYSFSFADWHDRKRMGFGALRVLNDDTIAPTSGFGMHPHRDMEIVTIPTGGTLAHKDSMGNEGQVPEGDVQAMSAGRGVVHAEYNASKDTPLTLFQIWVGTARKGVAPRYAQRHVGWSDTPGLTQLIVPEGMEGGLPIYQDAYISRLVVDKDRPHTYGLHSDRHGLYVFVVEGTVAVADEHLERRDALGVWDTNAVSITTPSTATLLCIEVPMS